MATGTQRDEDVVTHMTWTVGGVTGSRCTTTWAAVHGYESEGFEPLVTYHPNTKTRTVRERLRPMAYPMA